MNLLEERWIPIRRASGRRERIAPHEITDCIDTDPVVALAAPRPDFNGALIQFLIGLVQTAWVRADKFWELDDMLWSPPAPQVLASLFAPLKHAFELDGDGPRFMQDNTVLHEDADEKSIRTLLMEAPGETTVTKNEDHFVKRSDDYSMCPSCAAAALFTLQTFAPSGGSGNLTSVRGAGPLTTLVVSGSATDQIPRLWANVALNVLATSDLRSLCNRDKSELSDIFVWLGRSSRQKDAKRLLQPLDVHPAHMYWAAPRRIWLSEPREGTSACSCCGEPSSESRSTFVARPRGNDYKGPWRHPLSPYRQPSGTSTPLCVQPRPGGFVYRHWLGWTFGGNVRGERIVPALVVSALWHQRSTVETLRVWAFGFDVKPGQQDVRCWYETTFPLFDLPVGTDRSAESAELIVAMVEPLIAAAEAVAQYLRFAVRDAWFGKGETRGDLGFVEASLWNRTEREFFALVEQAIALCREHGRAAFDQTEPLRRGWRDTLRRSALRLFDEVAASGRVEAGNPAKLAAAHRALCNQLDGAKLLAALGLSPAEPPGAAGRSRRTGGKATKPSLEAR